MDVNDKVLIRSGINLGKEQFGTVIDFDGNMVQVHFDLTGMIGSFYDGELVVVEMAEFESWACQFQQVG